MTSNKKLFWKLKGLSIELEIDDNYLKKLVVRLKQLLLLFMFGVLFGTVAQLDRASAS